MGYMVMKEKYLQRIIGAVLRLLHSEHHASSTAPIHVNCIYNGQMKNYISNNVGAFVSASAALQFLTAKSK